MLLVLCTLAEISQARIAQAQDAYPSRPIRLVVPYPAGGTADAMARALGQEITAAWGQPVVVENCPGAGTIVGAEHAARSAPDGLYAAVHDGFDPHDQSVALHKAAVI